MEEYKCNKEAKIDAMDRKLNRLNTVVMENANGDSLLGMAKATNQVVKDMSSDIRALLTFQTVVETQREMQDELQEKKIRKRQIHVAIIALAVGAGLTLLGMIMTMVIQ